MKTAKILLVAILLAPLLSKVHLQQQNGPTAYLLNTHKKDSLVRGVSFEDFRKSVNDFSDSATKALLDSSWQLWKAEKWAALEHFFKADRLNCGWPPDSGAISLQYVSLDSGTLIDRYGGYYITGGVFHDSGNFVSYAGVPFPQRALPQSALKSPYRLYRIIKPIAHIKRGQIIPWFNQPGLGIQFQMPENIDQLKHDSCIVEISSKPPN